MKRKYRLSPGYRLSKYRFLKRGRMKFSLSKGYKSGRIRSGLAGIRANQGWHNKSKGFKRKRYFSRSWS